MRLFPTRLTLKKLWHRVNPDSRMDTQRAATVLNFDPVSEEESGQKLINFLQKRLSLPPSMLHRWIRTGQTRLNGKRCKPFERVCAGDVIRLPPFAAQMAGLESGGKQRVIPATPENLRESGILPFLGAVNGIWALDKPVGLPVHGGSGHTDSVSSRLRDYFEGNKFIPTPGHRLDKETSGVLLIGATYAGLRVIQDNLRSGGLLKEYVAWVDGNWPYTAPVLLRHYLESTAGNKQRTMRVPRSGRQALCIASQLRAKDCKSLLHILLLTGRKHQIRLQLAALGHPVVGDCRYGSGTGATPLYLHAFSARLPDCFEFKCLPSWQGEFALEVFPDHLNPDLAMDVLSRLEDSAKNIWELS